MSHRDYRGHLIHADGEVQFGKSAAPSMPALPPGVLSSEVVRAQTALLKQATENIYELKHRLRLAKILRDLDW